ncbi:MAG: nucleotidyltransferase domain-containing protein [Patescibacteria group bacterium]
MAELSGVEKALFKTIVYYNCLDYPLTLDELEVFSFGVNSAHREISSNLDGLIKKKLIEKFSGFYFLRGRKNLVQEREEKNKIAKEKWKKILKAARWLNIIPYIKAVFASGSLAFDNTTKESDLDVLIVVKSGRIWTSRFLTVILLGLLGVRRKRYQLLAPDKICLNHFITDKSLYIPRKSIYTAQLYARLVSILLEDESLLDEFAKANSWVGGWVRGWPETIKNQNAKIKMAYSARRLQSLWRRTTEATSAAKAGQNYNSKIKTLGEKILNTKFGDWLENILRKYQLRRINNFHLTYKAGGRVKADDESLEFHPDSPELRIIEKYNKTMEKLEFPELGREQDSGLLT